MGNCLVQESSMHWGGDDWGSPAPDAEADHQPFFSAKRRRSNHNAAAVYEDAEMGEKGSFGNSTATTSSSASSRDTTATEVKIKVTRRQLEMLLGKVDLKELSVQEVLAQLMMAGAGAGEFGVHEESWRPALNSIPE